MLPLIWDCPNVATYMGLSECCHLYGTVRMLSLLWDCPNFVAIVGCRFLSEVRVLVLTRLLRLQLYYIYKLTRPWFTMVQFVNVRPFKIHRICVTHV